MAEAEVIKLETIIIILKEHKQEMRDKYGVKEIGIFGSYVRGEQREGSDVDVLVEFEQEARPSLFGFVALQEELCDLLGTKVDLVDRRGLKPYIGRRILSEVVWLLGGDGGTPA